MHSIKNNLQPNAKAPNNTLTAIERYNAQVIDNIKKSPLTPLQHVAIKNFDDQVQRNNLNDQQYNREVEKFNDFEKILVKRVIDSATRHDTGKYYQYINYPMINGESFKSSMDNYRAEISRYNNSLILQNIEINKYNCNIPKNFTGKEVSKIIDFKVKNERLFVKTYNKKVEIFNEKHGNIVRKKRVQKVKFASELVFSVALGFYTSQLRQRNANNINIGVPTSVPKNQLPALKIDYRKLATHKIDGLQRLDICKKTAQNHFKRLREAGIIQNYAFINSSQPIKCAISSKILVILDGNPPKHQNAENQFFKPNRSKDLHNDSDTTRTNLKKNEIKDFAYSTVNLIATSFSIENKETNTDNSDFYKNTQLNKQKNKPAAPRKLTKKSENLLKKVIPAHQLATQLANNDYLQYSGLRLKDLHAESVNGMLSNDEFRRLVILDFFKISNKIYRNSTVFGGVWTKTIQRALDTWYIDTGYNVAFHKGTIFKHLKADRWKLNFARKWFLNDKTPTPLFPYDYFDKTRTLSKEIGFFGLHKIYKTNKKINENRIASQQKEKSNATIRKTRLTAQYRIEKRVKSYLNGNMLLGNLYDYVQNNYSIEWLQHLPTIINKQTEIMNQKHSA